MIQFKALKRRRGGFTLIELLVVVLILAILMAVSLPLYLNAVADSQRKTCRANMQTIANAVQASRVKNQYNDYSVLIANGVTTASLLDLVLLPVCPAGGSYTITNGSSGNAQTFKVNCSITTHGTFEPNIDSN
jgi:type IV pilus assembly protein PilA